VSNKSNGYCRNILVFAMMNYEKHDRINTMRNGNNDILYETADE